MESSQLYTLKKSVRKRCALIDDDNFCLVGSTWDFDIWKCSYLCHFNCRFLIAQHCSGSLIDSAPMDIFDEFVRCLTTATFQRVEGLVRVSEATAWKKR